MSKWPYNTARWKRLRRAKLSRQPLCEHCQLIEETTTARVVDHLVAISNGGSPFPSLDELQSLCQICHNRKTGSDKIGQDHVVKGYDLEGNPIDQSHEWYGGAENHEKHGDRRPIAPSNADLVLDKSDIQDTTLWV